MVKRRSVSASGYFNNIIRGADDQNRMGFKEMWMSIDDFEFVSKHIDDLIFIKKSTVGIVQS